MRRDNQGTSSGTLGSLTETIRAARRPWAACGTIFLLLILAGCSGGGGLGPTTGRSSVGLAIDRFQDGTVDVTVSIVDASSLAAIYNQAYLAQATPFSVDFPLQAESVLVSVTITLHHDPSARLCSGTNLSPGDNTITDFGVDFTRYMLPLFVVNESAIPPVLVDVQAITDSHHLALSGVFPAGTTYSLYRSRPVSARITYTGAGTSVLPLAMWDNTLGTYSVSTRY